MNEKIFIAIPCFRDSMIINTIESAIKNAEKPNNLIFGCFIRKQDDDFNFFEYAKNKKYIKYEEVDLFHDPIGIGYDRSMANSFITDEKYYLQIDSHMMFTQNWDINLIKELNIANEVWGKSILTAAVKGFYDWENQLTPQVSHTQYLDPELWKIEMPLVRGRIEDKKISSLMLEKFYSGAFVFAYSEYAKEVTFPDGLVWDAEQPFMSIRTFTAGYEMITPTKNYLYHFCRIKPDGTIVRKMPGEIKEISKKYLDQNSESIARYLEILKNNKIDHNSGLFSTRTLDEYIEYIEYDIFKKVPLNDRYLYDLPPQIPGKPSYFQT